MFLTQDELKTLTGHDAPGWQSRWLSRHGWRFERAANGRIVVSKAYAESRLSAPAQTSKPELIDLALHGDTNA